MASSEQPACALTIAGSDSGGGAGIQADLKAFAAFQVHGLSAISALTAQSTVEVRAVHPVPAAFVAQQIDTLTDDFRIDAVKTGMLADPATVQVILDRARSQGWKLVVDPVMVAASGARLVGPEVVRALTGLYSLAELVTPNLDEVEVLLGWRPRDAAEMERAGRQLLDHGPRAALIKGGHLEGDPIDVLVQSDGSTRVFEGGRIETRAGHGTGCTYAAAITALLARGFSREASVERARRFVREALRTAAASLGAGASPLHPFHAFYPALGSRDDGAGSG